MANTGKSRAWLVCALTAASITAGCGGGDGSSAPSSAMPAATGTLRIALTDAPACGFEQVNITVQSVRVHPSSTANDNDSGWTTIALSPPRKIDLLTLTNGALLDLGQTAIAAGQYSLLRLVLAPNAAGSPANSVVPIGGAETPLDTPSATQNGLKVNHVFTVSQGQLTDLVVDFDACRSIVTRGNGTFGLKPVLTVLPRNAATIAGVVDPAVTSVTVSAQKDGVVLRATVPNATGQFALAPVDPSKSPYDVVLSANGRATSVVSGVPAVSNTTTTISTASAPLAMPASTTGIANGKVLPASASGAVRALQQVGAVPTIEVAHVNADASGNYSLTLPLDAPRLATYSTTLPLTFNAQPASAAKYTLEASAAGYATQTRAVTVGAAPVTNDFTLVPAP
jgi:uncharacterized protein DUF4382